jgi:GNAT superfamily N-acetyltransferase
MRIVCIRDFPDLLERAVDYFSERWKIDKLTYYISIKDNIYTEKAYPRWYLMLCEEEIVGGYGMIENDFMKRTDLYPWLCALYIEPHLRGKGLGGKLLEHSIFEGVKHGFEKIYLNTDHIGYYEKYGWLYIGDSEHLSGDMVRVYEINTKLIYRQTKSTD